MLGVSGEGVEHHAEAQVVASEESGMIALCIPWVKVDPAKKFLPQMMEWYAENKARHDLRLNMKMYRPLYQVQDDTVRKAIKVGASHVLFTEDDHWNFPPNGLQVLLDAVVDVVGFQTFRKEYPYSSMSMRQNDISISLIGTREQLRERGLVLRPHERDGGDLMQATDLITWAFTLVRTSVFERMYDAGRDPFAQQGPVPTDSFFCQYCRDLGVPKHVHFGAQIAHGEHHPDELEERRKIEGAVMLGRDKKRTRAPEVRVEDPAAAAAAAREQFRENNPGVAA